MQQGWHCLSGTRQCLKTRPTCGLSSADIGAIKPKLNVPKSGEFSQDQAGQGSWRGVLACLQQLEEVLTQWALSNENYDGPASRLIFEFVQTHPNYMSSMWLVCLIPPAPLAGATPKYPARTTPTQLRAFQTSQVYWSHMPIVLGLRS